MHTIRTCVEVAELEQKVGERKTRGRNRWHFLFDEEAWALRSLPNQFGTYMHARAFECVFAKKIILPCVGFPAQQCPKRRKEVIARNPHRQFFGGRSAGGKQGNQSGVTTIPSRSHQLVSTAKESEEEEDLRL